MILFEENEFILFCMIELYKAMFDDHNRLSHSDVLEALRTKNYFKIRRLMENIFYERRVYDSVDDMSSSKIISQKSKETRIRDLNPLFHSVIYKGHLT